MADGYESYHKTPGGWQNGGGPDRFCLMPKESESCWEIRGDLSFVHFYCTDVHLREIGERIWDRSPASFTLQETTFGDDVRIASLYRHFLLGCDWQQQANHLALSSASTLLMTHLIQHYSNVQWRLPTVKGGLAPAVTRNIVAWIEANLDKPLTLAEMAREAALSEFHFARMFRQSINMAPHQYVMQRRMAKAQQLLCHSDLSLTDIALACGFSSLSHFSNRFKSITGMAPSRLRPGPPGK